MAEQCVEVPIVPLYRARGPCAFQTAGDRVGAFAAAERVFPAEALLLNGGALRFGADIFARIGSAVGFAERVPAGNERNGLLVIHRHAGEGFADIARRGDWIGLSIRPLRIHINQSYLTSCERFIRETFARMAMNDEETVAL